MPKVGEDLPKEMRLAGFKKLKPIQQEFLNNYLHKDKALIGACSGPYNGNCSGSGHLIGAIFTVFCGFPRVLLR